MTKQLQEQYLNDFEDDGFSVVKGRSDFNCLSKLEDIKNNKENYRCDTGSCAERYKFLCKYWIINPAPDNKVFLVLVMHLENLIGETLYIVIYWE